MFNDDFSSTTGGWTGRAYPQSFGLEDGKLRIVTDNPHRGAQNTVTTTIGEEYTFEFKVSGLDLDRRLQILIYNAASSTYYNEYYVWFNNGRYQISFTAASTSTRIEIYPQDFTGTFAPNCVFYLDDMRLYSYDESGSCSTSVLAAQTIVNDDFDTDTICGEAFGGYRYSFQGQEHDDEIKGEGNSVNYTFRMHDPRIGRFFAVDPLTAKYPQWSPYQFGGNQVISSIELEGLEPSEDLNTASTDKVYQGKDKGANSNNTIYNWRVKITSNTDNAGVTTESRQWYQDGTTYNGPTAKENAEMAEDVYGSDKFKVWKHTAPNTDYHLRKTYSDINGFKAALYSRDIDGEVFYTLAFAGTEDMLDARTDVQSGIGFEGDQLKNGAAISKRVDKWVSQQNNGNNLNFTGHSLGGGLAAYGSFKTGRQATTFNAMGLGATLEVTSSYSVYQKNLIRAFVIVGEPLDVGQFAKADGTKLYILPKPKSSFLDKHSMSQFLNR